MNEFKWAEAIEERRYYIIDSNSYNEHNTTTDGYYMRPDEWVLLEVIDLVGEKINYVTVHHNLRHDFPWNATGVHIIKEIDLLHFEELLDLGYWKHIYTKPEFTLRGHPKNMVIG